MTSEHHKLSFGVRELEEQIPKILGEFDHSPNPGMNRNGISARR
jgi:hypothetical protein